MTFRFLHLTIILLLLTNVCTGQQNILEWKSWKTPATSLSDIHFISEKEGWAVGEKYLFHTKDGGKTWMVSPSATGNRFISLTVYDAQKIKIFGDFGVETTTDGGKTWRYEPVTGKIYTTEYSIVDSLLHFKKSYKNGVERSNDGGRTWMSCPDNRVPFFSDSTHAWSIENGSPSKSSTCLYHSDDRGENWQKVCDLGSFFVIAMQFIDNTGWLLGQRNKLRITNDGGKTFTEYDVSDELVPTIDSKLDICFTSKTKGWICSSAGYILYTEDGGKKWKKSTPKTHHNVTTSINGICFSDKLNGWVLLDGDKLLKTKNAGESWDTLKLPTTTLIRKMHFFNENNGILVDEVGVVYQTQDGGQLWRTSYPAISNGEDHVSAVQFFEKTNEIWCSSGNRIKRMQMNAIKEPVSNSFPPAPPRPIGTWWVTKTVEGVREIVGFTRIDSCVYLIGDSNAGKGGNYSLYISKNAGNDWVRDTVVKNARKIFFLDTSNGWVVTPESTIYHTTDGGKTWSVHSFPKLEIGNIHFVSPRKGLGIGRFALYKTEDGGETWIKLGLYSLRTVFWKSDIGYWMGGFAESLLHFENF